MSATSIAAGGSEVASDFSRGGLGGPAGNWVWFVILRSGGAGAEELGLVCISALGLPPRHGAGLPVGQRGAEIGFGFEFLAVAGEIAGRLGCAVCSPFSELCNSRGIGFD